MLLRAAWPGREIACWLPGDVFDQVGRNPLVTALKAHNLRPQCGEHTVMARGSLAAMLRTEAKGRRLLTIDSGAHDTLMAMASGYNFPIKANGERTGEPERNSSRTLIEALEVLTYAINRQDTASNFTPNSVNPSGARYMSALGNGR